MSNKRIENRKLNYLIGTLKFQRKIQ